MTLEEIIKEAECRNKNISSVIKDKEANEQGVTEESLMNKMREHLQVMKEAAAQGTARHITSLSGITGGEGFRLWHRTGEALR